MNAPGNKLVDDFDVPEMAPVKQAFLDGAHFIYGHTVMQRALGLGYQSEWAQANLPTRRERNDFYTTVGYRVPPEAQAGGAARQRCNYAGGDPERHLDRPQLQVLSCHTERGSHPRSFSFSHNSPWTAGRSVQEGTTGLGNNRPVIIMSCKGVGQIRRRYYNVLVEFARQRDTLLLSEAARRVERRAPKPV